MIPQQVSCRLSHLPGQFSYLSNDNTVYDELCSVSSIFKRVPSIEAFHLVVSARSLISGSLIFPLFLLLGATGSLSGARRKEAGKAGARGSWETEFPVHSAHSRTTGKMAAAGNHGRRSPEPGSGSWCPGEWHREPPATRGGAHGLGHPAGRTQAPPPAPLPRLVPTSQH